MSRASLLCFCALLLACPGSESTDTVDGAASDVLPPEDLQQVLDALALPDVSQLDTPAEVATPDVVVDVAPDLATTDLVAPDLPADLDMADGLDSGQDSEPVDAGPPAPGCGNGRVDPGEVCDDGNELGGDWCAADCKKLVDVSTYETYGAHTSYRMLTTSNGLSAALYAVVDLEATPQNKLTAFRDHCYSAYDEGDPAKDYLFDLYFGYRASGVSSANTWLNGVTPDEAAYVPGTGIIHTVQRAAGLRFDQYSYVPFHHPTPAINDGTAGRARLLVATVKVSNESGAAVDDAAIFSLINVHVGGEGDFVGETVTTQDGMTVTESRGATSFVYRNLVAAGSSVTADNGGAPNNPWTRVAAGLHFEGYVEAETSDDIAVGFENRLTEVGPLEDGASRWVGVVMALGNVGEIDGFVAGRTPEALLAAEVGWWESWHASEPVPAGATDAEQALYRQSTAVLKMGQVRETEATGCPSGKCYGQILASLVPGIWNITWVRDASYAIRGLVRAGHLVEARDGLAFMLNAEMRRDGDQNYYQKRFIESSDPATGVWGLGVDLSADYALSVTRYFGRGLEESDGGAEGPNIEWDNWGLFLWALADYAASSGDIAFVQQHWVTVSERIADLLVELIEPELGLLVPDSSIWERHWCPHGVCDEPNTRKHFAYSSIVAVAGLEGAARLAELVGDSDRQGAYLAAADTLSVAIREHLIATPPLTGRPAVAGNLEELPFQTFYLDVASVEAINVGVVAPGSREAFGTIAAFDAYLRIGAHSPGYRRNDDPTWYDNQEWVVVDLRTVSALAAMRQLGKARTLLDWITGQAAANSNLIAELLSDGVYAAGSEDDRWQPGQDVGGDYQGAIPMTGFGPGAYLLALTDVLAAEAAVTSEAR